MNGEGTKEAKTAFDAASKAVDGALLRVQIHRSRAHLEALSRAMEALQRANIQLIEAIEREPTGQ